MDEIPGWAIVAIVLTLVVLFNIGIASSALRRQPRKDGLFRGRTFSEMINPWYEEDQSLAKLRRDVEALGGETKDSSDDRQTQ